MTREEMVKKAYKPYMVIMYKVRHYSEFKQIECLLVAVDFDNELMTLQPLEDGNFEVEEATFVTSISNCIVPTMHRNQTKIQEERKLQ